MNLTDTVPAGAAAEPPRPVQMAEWVASQLRGQIYAGHLKPGHKLSESALCDSLGVSRNTLREAFAVLAGEYLVSRIANRGVFVASPGPDEVREIYRTRRIIESGAICWGEPTPTILASLDGAIEKARAARDEDSIPGMADANQDFHMALVSISGSASLEALMEQFLASIRLVFHAMATKHDFHSHYIERNAALVAQIRDGKRDEAAGELQHYLNEAEAELLTLMGAVS